MKSTNPASPDVEDWVEDRFSQNMEDQLSQGRGPIYLSTGEPLMGSVSMGRLRTTYGDAGESGGGGNMEGTASNISVLRTPLVKPPPLPVLGSAVSAVQFDGFIRISGWCFLLLAAISYWSFLSTPLVATQARFADIAWSSLTFLVCAILNLRAGTSTSPGIFGVPPLQNAVLGPACVLLANSFGGAFVLPFLDAEGARGVAPGSLALVLAGWAGIVILASAFVVVVVACFGLCSSKCSQYIRAGRWPKLPSATPASGKSSLV